MCMKKPEALLIATLPRCRISDIALLAIVEPSDAGDNRHS